VQQLPKVQGNIGLQTGELPGAGEGLIDASGLGETVGASTAENTRDKICPCHSKKRNS
jgi:hypothetical protein